MELYAKFTSTLNDIFTTQLGGSVQWQDVPGELIKVSASSGGYTWGFNSTKCYVCKEPCTGSWTESTPAGRILDITTDDTRVYVLSDTNGGRSIYSKAVNGSGAWTTLSAPFDSNTVVATTKDIFVDTTRGVFKCGSPCTLPAWTPTVVDPVKLQGRLGRFQMTGDVNGNLKGNPKQPLLTADFRRSVNVKPTSASARFAYGTESGKAKVYRNGQWHDIPGLATYSIAAVSGEIDDTALYATTTDGQVLRCAAPCSEPSMVSKIGTPGIAPSAVAKQVTINPQSNQVWLLSNSKIYNRKDEVPIDVNTQVRSIDSQRDSVLLDISGQYGRADAKAMVGDQLAKTQDMVHNARPRIDPLEDPRIVRRKIDFMDVRKSVFLLQIACATVFVILVILILLPQPFSGFVAFIAGCFGAMLVVSFSTS